jgi:hypothetical protein
VYRDGLIAPDVEVFELDDALEAYRRLEAGELTGRAVIAPLGTPTAHGDSRNTVRSATMRPAPPHRGGAAQACAPETRDVPALSAMEQASGSVPPEKHQSPRTCSPSKMRLISVSDNRSASMDSRAGSS